MGLLFYITRVSGLFVLQQRENDQREASSL